jgi:uncharacterized protein YyaL (SSP411 family)
MGKRLSQSPSLYLRQHSDNPVDWYPWGDEAFERARQEGKPVFLSIGYSSCHWCHVMEEESFRDPEVAEILNNRFISVKVDREEHPEVDDAYMTAVQLMSGHGGWPMSVFLTPQRKPFFAGTYFPKEDHGIHLGFRSLLQRIADAWHTRREEIEEIAEHLSQAVTHQRGLTFKPLDEPLNWRVVERAIGALEADFDEENGGFGEAPKFPQHGVLLFLLHFSSMRGEGRTWEMAERTLEKMMLGGIHDHVGGGFHRYSTDARWVLPHFEKMLYDNALLLWSYGKAFEISRNSEFKRAANRIVQWLLREMDLEGEGFAGSLDADTLEGEGAYYTWTLKEIQDALKGRGEEFARAFHVTEEGNFEEEASLQRTGKNVLYLHHPQGDTWDRDLEVLREVREQRPRPARDPKVLIAWNGLLLSGLVAVGEISFAEKLARALLKHQPLPHQVVEGTPYGRPYLDVAFFLQGLLDLKEATGQSYWEEAGKALYQQIQEEFSDGQGGWFFSSPHHENILGRRKPFSDDYALSPYGVMVRNALRLGDISTAERALSQGLGWMQHLPQAVPTLLWALSEYLNAYVPAYAVAPPTVRLLVEPVECKVEGNQARYQVVMKIPEGFHMGGKTSGGEGTPLEVKIRGFVTSHIESMPRDEVLKGEVRWSVVAEVPEGKEGEGKMQVSYQLCTETECLPPESREVSLVWYRE